MKLKLIMQLIVLSSIISSCNINNASNSSINSLSSSFNDSESVVETHPIVIELLNDINELIEASNKEINEDIYQMYLAKMETLLLDKSIVLPLNAYDMYLLSKVANCNENKLIFGGEVFYKAKDFILVDKIISKNDYKELLHLDKSSKKAYLLDKGYNLSNDYVTTKTNLGIFTLDPYQILSSFEYKVLSNCFDGLFKIDEFGNIACDMVDTFNISEDGLVYTFTLKDNLYFIDSNGLKYSQINANCFKYGLNHLLDCNYNSNLFLNIKNAVEYLSLNCTFEEVGIDIIDNLTFKIELNKPDRDFLNLLANNYLLPLDKEFYLSMGGVFGVNEYKTASNSINYKYGNISDLSTMLYSGAYYPSLISNDKVQLIKNDNHYDKDNIMVKSISYINDNSNNLVLIDKILKGDYSEILFNNEQLDQIIDNEIFLENYNMYNNHSLRYIGFNTQRDCYSISSTSVKSNKTEIQIENYKKAFANENFRKAIIHSIDRTNFTKISSINDTIKNNFTFNDSYTLKNEVISEYEDVISKNSSYKNILSYYIEKENVNVNLDEADGIYNIELAKEYLDKAKLELKDVMNEPIIIDVLSFRNNKLINDQAMFIKNSIENVLGVDNVKVDIINANSPYEYYMAGSSGLKCYDMYFDLSVYSDFNSDLNLLENIYYNLMKNI